MSKSPARQLNDAAIAIYGEPRRLPDDIEGEVIVLACASREAAEVFAAGNRHFHGHPSWAELRESVGWVNVVDLRPDIARRDAAIDEPTQ